MSYRGTASATWTTKPRLVRSIAGIIMKLTLSRLHSSAPFVWELRIIASAAIGKYEAKRYCGMWCIDVKLAAFADRPAKLSCGPRHYFLV
jgi:hypothetical protein